MTIQFGIVGCGYIAHRHAAQILNHDKAVLGGCSDIDMPKANAFADQYQTRSYSYSELLQQDEIDIITVCAPNGVHHELAIQALHAGKHVLVEKPMATSKANCEAMIQAAQESGNMLYVVKQNRFNPPVQAVKKLIDEGALGDILMVSVNCFWNRNAGYYTDSLWRGTKSLDGGTLYTQFSHFVDILYYLFGEIEEVQGITSNLSHKDLVEYEDTGCCTFKFVNGGLGSFAFTTSAYEKNMEGSITLFASNGTIKIGGKYLNTIDYQVTNGLDISDLPQSGPANNYGHYEGSMSNHDKVIHNVVETLNGREKIMTNAFEGMKVVEMIEKIYQGCTTP